MVQYENKHRTMIKRDVRAMTQPRAPRTGRLFSFRRVSLALSLIALAGYGWMILIGSIPSSIGSVANAQSLEPVKIGGPAPDVAFTTTDGTERWLAEFRGQPMMLWFYASWCPTCQVGTVAVAEKIDELKQAGVQIIQLQLYDNLGYPGPSIEDFAKRYAGSVTPSSNWLWGQASLEASFTYDPQGYPDIYFLIDRDGIVRAIEPAPNVTMNKILAFARNVQVSKGGD